MFTKICVPVMVMALLACGVPVSAGTTGSLQLFVAPGASGGDGTISSPYGSLTEARDRIREMKKTGAYPEGGVTVNLREGRYFMTEGLELTEEDSGTEEAPVVWRAYGNEEVQLIGGVGMDLSEFAKVSDADILKRLPAESKDKVYQINLKEYGFTQFDELPQTGHSTAYLGFIDDDYNNVDSMELFFNDEVMTLSRWPNEGFVRIAELIETGEYARHFVKNNAKDEELWKPGPYRASTFTVDSEGTERLKRWQSAEDIWAFAYWQFDWSDLTVGLTLNYDDKSFTNRHTLAFPPTTGQRIYFYNILEELDEPGEWYLNRTNGILYFYPTASEGEVLFSVLSEPMFDLTGVSNVSFQSLAVKAVRNDAFRLTECENIDISLCSISKTTQYGIETSGCKNCSFISNHVYETGVGGILLSGGNVKTLEPGNNLAENNWVHDYARIKSGYSPAVGLYGVGNIARHNKMHGSDNLAMRIVGNDHLVEYNEIFDVLRTAADMGAIYMYREKTSRGTVIRNNYFHDIAATGSTASHGIQGIYYDEMADGVIAENNLFVNFAGDCVFVNSGRDHVIKNNIFLNCGGGVKISAIGLNPAYGYQENGKFEGIYTELYQEHLHETEPYAKYEHLANILNDAPREPKYNLVENNVTAGCGYDFKWTEIGSDVWGKLYEQNSIHTGLVAETADDLGFADLAAGNYNLRSDAAVFEQLSDFEAPDFINMGMYTPWLARKLTGTVSLAPDSPIAYTGFEPGYVDSNNLAVTPVIEDDVTYAPLRFIAESLGGEASFDEETNVATVSLGEETITVNINDGTVAHNGAALADAIYIMKEGRLLLPLRVIAEALNKTVTWYPQGLIIVGDDEVIEQTETALIEELRRRLT